MSVPRRRLVIGFAAALALAGAGARPSPDPAEDDARIIVASYLGAELGLRAAHGLEDVSPATIVLDSVIGLGRGVRIQRARAIMASGIPQYLLGRTRTRLVRLGGFPDADPVAFWMSVPSEVRAGPPITRAILLATALDLYGARHLIRADSATSAAAAEVIGVWRRRSPATWPADTAVALPDGGLEVRITVLSAVDVEETPGVWQPVSYSFRFDSTSKLVAWARRTDAQFIAKPATPG
jgi:hypothetical protein